MQATMTYTPFNPKNLLLVLLIAVIVMAIGTTFSHALTKHGADAISAEECFDKYGTRVNYIREDGMNHIVSICLIPDPNNPGKFIRGAIRVVEKIKGSLEEITKFTDIRLTTPQEVIAFCEEDMGKYGYFLYVDQSWKPLFPYLLLP